MIGLLSALRKELQGTILRPQQLCKAILTQQRSPRGHTGIKIQILVSQFTEMFFVMKNLKMLLTEYFPETVFKATIELIDYFQKQFFKVLNIALRISMTDDPLGKLTIKWSFNNKSNFLIKEIFSIWNFLKFKTLSITPDTVMMLRDFKLLHPLQGDVLSYLKKYSSKPA